jgi:mannose-1-phosphate guanylyltransferase/mannose-6-phosphate isomerase
MFMFNVDKIIQELIKHSPDIVKSVRLALHDATKNADFIFLDEKSFKSSPSISIDYALMEKSKCVVVVSLDAKWSDVGSWSALYNIGKKDSNGNVITGNVIIKDAINTYVNANNRKIVTIGVENLIVVDTPDATFISTREKAHEVSEIVKKMQLSRSKEFDSHRKVYRPWGWYDSIDLGMNYQVKRLHVKPGAKLSLQKHHKRAEHWVVVKGQATVVNGGVTLILNVGGSTYIPLGAVHSLENKEKELLEVIEVQSGEYLGEDDIIRIDDIYGRK